MALTTCKKCGGQISDRAAYCVHCGEPLHHVIKTCPSCNVENEATAKFCSNCGWDLNKPVKLPDQNTIKPPTQQSPYNKKAYVSSPKSDNSMRQGPPVWIIAALSLLTTVVIGFVCYTIFIGPIRPNPVQLENAEQMPMAGTSLSLEEQKQLERGSVFNEKGEFLIDIDTFTAQLNEHLQHYHKKYSYSSELIAQSITSDFSYMDRSNIKNCIVYKTGDKEKGQEFANISGFDLENRFIDGIVGKMAKIVCYADLKIDKTIDTEAIFVSIIQICDPTITLEDANKLAAQMILSTTKKTKNYTENGVTYSVSYHPLTQDKIRLEARMQGISSTWDEEFEETVNRATSNNSSTSTPKRTEEQLISDLAEICKTNMPSSYCGYEISKSEIGDSYFILKISYDGIYDAYQTHNMHWLQVMNDINDLCSNLKSTWELAGYQKWHVMIHILNDKNYDHILFTSLDGKEYNV